MKASLPIAFGTEHEYVTHLANPASAKSDYLDCGSQKIAVALLEHFQKVFYPRQKFDPDKELIELLTSKTRRLKPDSKERRETEAHLEHLIRVNHCLGFMTPLGGRFYLDHGYFEGCTPESADPFELLACELAQDELLAEEFSKLFGNHPEKPRLYKNISDGCGNSQAAHRNFCLSNDLWIRIFHKGLGRLQSLNYSSREAMLLATWHVVEQVFGGAGKYGLENESVGKIDDTTFQLSGRADFIYLVMSGETTQYRPLINSRRESLANSEYYGRYHCINGDANRAHWSHLFKIGLTAMILGMLEDGCLNLDYYVEDPVSAVKKVSCDTGLAQGIKVVSWQNGSIFRLGALEIIKDILSAMGRYLSSRSHPAWCGQIYDKAAWVVSCLENDPRPLRSVLDWKIKETFKGRPNGFNLHLNYHALYNPTRMIYQAMVDNGDIETVISREEIEKYKKSPAETTRAYFRGNFLRRFSDQLDFFRVSWDEIVFPRQGVIIDLGEPIHLTKAECGDIFDKADLELDDLLPLASFTKYRPLNLRIRIEEEEDR